MDLLRTKICFNFVLLNSGAIKTSMMPLKLKIKLWLLLKDNVRISKVNRDVILFINLCSFMYSYYYYFKLLYTLHFSTSNQCILSVWTVQHFIELMLFNSFVNGVLPCIIFR